MACTPFDEDEQRTASPKPGYPVPANEDERIHALWSLQILDSDFDPEYEAITDMASRIFEVPVAMVSLVDEHRQWFKSACGFGETRQTPREHAFCNYTISLGELFVVENALEDPRFADNPLVTGEPYLRFYAGVPLNIGDGAMVGSFCIIDRKPRTLSADQKLILRQLGDMVAGLMRHGQEAQANIRMSQSLFKKKNLLEMQSENLQAQKRLLDCACDMARMGAWEFNIETGSLYWSDGMFAIHEMPLDVTPDEELVRSLYRPGDYKRMQQKFNQMMRDFEPFSFECQVTTVTGQRRWMRLTANVERVDGVAVRRYGLKQDITAEKQSLDLITRMAERDGLTGLYNRSSLLRRLHADTRKHVDAALILLDLDGFKDINDTFGHPVGDICLRQISKRLKSISGKHYFISRIGGDEFAVLLEGNQTDEEILATAEQIRISAARPVQWHDQAFQFSASLGIAVSRQSTATTPDDVTPAELMIQADLALYKSKNSGRNCISVFEPAMKAESDQRVAILAAIRSALDNGELELFYQAKTCLRSNERVGFEALLRWNCPDGITYAPDAFRAALDDPLLSVEIGDFVLAAALDQAAAWMNSGVDFGSIAINAGAQQFRDENFGERILAEIRARKLAPGTIEIEVTEDVFLSRSANSVFKTCTLLRQNGVGIAFDDFGTGFASLTHLLEFPITALKIDRTFVGRLSTKAGTAEIVRAIVSLGKSLDVKVVAEGVETTEQAEFLRAIGCDYAQGYLFNHPSRVGEAEAFCKTIDIASVA